LHAQLERWPGSQSTEGLRRHLVSGDTELDRIDRLFGRNASEHGRHTTRVVARADRISRQVVDTRQDVEVVQQIGVRERLQALRHGRCIQLAGRLRDPTVVEHAVGNHPVNQAHWCSGSSGLQRARGERLDERQGQSDAGASQ
jgi:hypothetical protein